MNIIETIRKEIERRKNNAETMRERGNGKAYQSDEVEIIPRDQKTPTP